MSHIDIQAMRRAVESGRIQYRQHAIQRMAERDIRRQDVAAVLLTGERIEDYPDDYPLPSALFLGWRGSRPLHVVTAFNIAAATQALAAAPASVQVITVYEPGPDHFEPDFKTRRQ